MNIERLKQLQHTYKHHTEYPEIGATLRELIDAILDEQPAYSPDEPPPEREQWMYELEGDYLWTRAEYDAGGKFRARIVPIADAHGRPYKVKPSPELVRLVKLTLAIRSLGIPCGEVKSRYDGNWATPAEIAAVEACEKSRTGGAVMIVGERK